MDAGDAIGSRNEHDALQRLSWSRPNVPLPAKPYSVDDPKLRMHGERGDGRHDSCRYFRCKTTTVEGLVINQSTPLVRIVKLVCVSAAR